MVSSSSHVLSNVMIDNWIRTEVSFYWKTGKKILKCEIRLELLLTNVKKLLVLSQILLDMLICI